MATIEYETANGAIEEEYPSDRIWFDEDKQCWRITVGESDDGNQIVESIPRERVYYVRRVEEGISEGELDNTEAEVPIS